jgi:hypothetical protein
MEELSVVYIFYEHTREELKKHLNLWSSYSQSIREKTKFILVDDGSTTNEAFYWGFNFDINLEIYKITQDIHWNGPGARNLGCFMAKAEWVYFSDFDYVLPEKSVEWMLNTPLSPDVIYMPTVVTNRGKPKGKHLGCFLINRDLYWAVGGFEEDFAGSYGYDDAVFLASQLREYTKKEGDFEVIEFKEASTKLDRHKIARKNPLLSIAKDPRWGLSPISRRHLRFTWEPVFKHEI